MVKQNDVNTLPKPTEPLPPMMGSQISYNGLLEIQGRIYEDCKEDLRFPKCINTYKEMLKDATISPAINLLESSIAQVDWVVTVPEGYEEKLAREKEYVFQLMHDMEHSWNQFIRQASTYHRFGFGIHEKVLGFRRYEDGSKYNDGLVRIKKLPIISQDSIASWVWKDKGRELDGLKQVINLLSTNRLNTSVSIPYEMITNSNTKFISKKKFLHFTTTSAKDNPEGESSLHGVYFAWKFKTELEKFQAIGVSTDVRGLKVLSLPPQYMSTEATPEDKALYQYYQMALNSISTGAQSGLMLPMVRDDKGQALFTFEAVGVQGQKAYDTTQIIKDYKQEMLACLFSTQLNLGMDGTGSFSLAQSLRDISNIIIKSRLTELQDVINHDLLRQVFELNGWNTAVMPTIKFGSLNDIDLDTFSKAIQRIGSQGLMTDDAYTVNAIADKLNLPKPYSDLSEDIEITRQKLVGRSTRSGDGMEEGLPNGTGSSSGEAGDSTVGNNEDGG